MTNGDLINHLSKLDPNLEVVLGLEGGPVDLEVPIVGSLYHAGAGEVDWTAGSASSGAGHNVVLFQHSRNISQAAENVQVVS